MNNFIWKYKDADTHEVKNICNEFDVPKSIATIMLFKSILNREQSKSFFYSNLDNLHNPLLMQDMDIAIKHVLKVKDNNELILIIGDYDADGTTAASILYLFFKSISVDVDYFIPNRQTDGYGVSLKSIDYAKKIGATTIITCDCGITAVEQIEYANTLNINTIITDHHKQQDSLPAAVAILNPNRNDCNYPFKGLCGAGVAFKFCMGINNELGLPIENILLYCDLVAIATTADVVPIIDENRLMVKQGLNNILNETNDGIRALMKVSKLDANSLTVGKLGYWFIPKINAAGRLGDAGRAVKLFTTINPQLANQIALDLENENEKRKIITKQHENDAQRIIDSSIDLEKQKIIIIYKEDWHFGVVGIVASRVKDKYNFPTIVLTEDKGFFKGSCRSVSGFDIVNALSSCSDLLENFGGHPMAAGLSIKKENLDLFIIRMNDYAIENIKTSLKPILNIDYMLDFNEINSRFIKFLDHLEPYGPGNPKPIFATQKVKGFNDLELLGKDRNVLKCKINSPHIDLEVIGFQMVENYEKLLSYKNVDISYQIDKNIWRGKESIQLVLKDVIYSDE